MIVVRREYVEYTSIFSLAMLAGSLSYFLSLETPLTFAVLLLVPALFGVTAYFSKESFRKASLLSSVSLIFAPLKPGMAFVALAISLGTPLVSAFAGGSSFKDFYSSAPVPMLLVAVVLGSGSFVAFQERPELAEPLENRTVEFVSSQATEAVEDAGLLEQQAGTVENVVTQSSKASVARTRQLVLNSTGRELSFRNKRRLQQDFNRAQEEVPRQVSERAANLTQQTDISSRIRRSTKRLLENRPAALSVIVGSITYTVHPLIGILTAVFASLVRAAAPENY